MAKKKNNSLFITLSVVASFVAVCMNVYKSDHSTFAHKTKQAAQNTTFEVTSSSGLSGAQLCAVNLFQGIEPEINNVKMREQSQVICYEGYAGRASYISKSNLYSAERLTAARANNKVERVNDFHPEPSVAVGKRAELLDYKRSGFDRGHLAPSDDMGTEQSQSESFSLTNMIPQVPKHNQQTWRNVESKTRALARKYGEVFTVTMPIYTDRNGNFPKIKAIGKDKVYIPLFVVKAIYVPKINQAVVVFSPNDKTNTVELISIQDFRMMTGIDPFPTLSQDIKEQMGGFFKW